MPTRLVILDAAIGIEHLPVVAQRNARCGVRIPERPTAERRNRYNLASSILDRDLRCGQQDISGRQVCVDTRQHKVEWVFAGEN